MAEPTRRYNLRNTKKKPQGVLLKRWEVEYLQLVKAENRRIPLETIRTSIRSSFEDSGIEQWRITLKCPLSQQRIREPARYVDCTHIECFDLETFLQMKTQKNFLVCPICQKQVEKPMANLRIDQYIKCALSELPDAIQVELKSDGSFTKIQEEMPIAPNVIDDEEPYVQEVKQEVVEDGIEYITLSDGEDEMSIVDMKPISLMPLNMDIKPNVALSSEPEQTHSGSPDDEEESNLDTSFSFDNLLELHEGINMNDAEIISTVIDTNIDSNLEIDMDEGERQNENQAVSEPVTSMAVDIPEQFHQKRKSNLQTHIINCNEKPHKCKHCSYACTEARQITAHMRTHTREKPYKCNQCSYACAFRSSFSRHMRTHSSEKPYKCNQCHFAASLKHNLKVHMRFHTGEKPYKCNQCSYASATSSHLKTHMRSHSDERPFKCDQCVYACKEKKTLQNHLRKIHI